MCSCTSPAACVSKRCVKVAVKMCERDSGSETGSNWGPTLSRKVVVVMESVLLQCMLTPVSSKIYDIVVLLTHITSFFVGLGTSNHHMSTFKRPLKGWCWWCHVACRPHSSENRMSRDITGLRVPRRVCVSQEPFLGSSLIPCFVVSAFLSSLASACDLCSVVKKTQKNT